MNPRRVQMTRHRPWRPDAPDAVIVDRRTRYGNPFTVAGCIANGYADSPAEAAEICVDVFRSWLAGSQQWQFADGTARRDAILAGLGRLRDRDLACWCKPGAPCHADVLIDLANKTAGDRR